MDLALQTTQYALGASAGCGREWVGRTLGERYRITRELGSGGMGRVFLAKHLLLNVPVAIKVLLHPDACAMLTKEALLLSRLQHPNIVRTIDLGWLEDGTNYLVMDYVEGVEIGAWLEDHARFQPARALGILRQVAAAADHSHARDVVHRDIKPSNILFDPECDDRVRLVDFGIACARDDAATEPSAFVGTPMYMAPEQARGDARGRSVDIYGIAALALEMLTGKPPYAADTYRATLAAMLAGPPSLPSARGVWLPGLDAVIGRGLHPDPKKRYATASAFVRSLESVLQATPRASGVAGAWCESPDATASA